MPNTKNQAQSKEVAAALAASKAIILTNYAGLSVSAQQELRKAVQDAGGKFSITKNTLLHIALKDQLGEVSDDLSKALEGPTAVLWAENDPVAPTKALVKFATDHELPTIKIGVMDGKVISVTDIKALSKLPGKQELYGMLVGQLNAPIYSFAQVLRANIQGLVFVINNYQNKLNG